MTMQEREQVKAEIKGLAKERDAIILAHYYVDEEIQELADYVGDSYALAKKVRSDSRKTVVFCGVSFMGESACILNPDKTVLVPNPDAVCPMALMADPARIAELRQKYDDLAVVCYINSTAEIKALSDVIVTSSNALKIVRSLPNKNIFFIPDANLGRYVAEQIPEKNIILNDGFCHVHTGISARDVESCFREHRGAKIISHPECKKEVVDLSDFIGSTKELIEFVQADAAQEYVVCTERGVLYEMKHVAPQKRFYFAGARQTCPNMKKISLENIRDCLKNNAPQAHCSEEIRSSSCKPLDKMLELAK